MNDTFYTLIVTAQLTPLARALAAGLSPGGVGMFTTGLSADGNEPATHFISSGWINAEIGELLTDADALYAACVEAGAEVTLAQCQALVTTSDVSDEEAVAALERLGLQMVRTEMSL